MDQRLEVDRPRRHACRIRQTGIAGERPHELQGPNVASDDRIVCRLEAGIEPPVEANLERHPAVGGGGNRTVGVGQRLRHRFLAPHRLPGGCGADDQVGVEPCRRRDGDGIDVGIVDEPGRVIGRPSAVLLSEPLSGARCGVGDHRQRRANSLARSTTRGTCRSGRPR